ncbi:MAG: ATP--guanido phosphotransferase [Clostridia bacterium]|nr:ATP--guanido phosphotransferase [Clostridia bacterium]
MRWYETEAKEISPVLSTRVRFARNLKDTPFPGQLDEAGKEQVFETVRDALADRELTFVNFGEAGELEKNAYVQTHLASAALAKGGKGTGLALSRDGESALLINEEDHLRLQVILPGKCPAQAVEKAMALEKELEGRLPVAFAKPWGYLTACPTNLGAGMRLSVMIHLPALRLTKRLNSLVRALNEAGMTVRGLFGEGSRGDGAVYQISNQMSGDKTPEEILAEFQRVLERVELEETRARDALLEADRIGPEDRAMRAFGALLYARRLRYSEFLELYSRVRFGRELGLAALKDLSCLDRLLVEVTPAPMVLADASLADETKRDVARAARVRAALGGK